MWLLYKIIFGSFYPAILDIFVNQKAPQSRGFLIMAISFFYGQNSIKKLILIIPSY